MRIFTFIIICVCIVCVQFSESYCAPIRSVRTGNWNDPTTWQTGTIPTSLDDVTIDAGHKVTVNGDAVCLSLVIGKQNGADVELIISGSNLLNILGELTINGGSTLSKLSVGAGTLNVGADLSFKAPAGNAELDIVSGTVNVVGNLDFGSGNGAPVRIRRQVDNYGIINVGGVQNGIADIEGNLPVFNVSVLPNDYFRSAVISGDWTNPNSWQTSRDGVNSWAESTRVPNASAKKVSILSGHTILLNSANSVSNLVINSSGVLDCSTNILSGPGPFELRSGASIRVANADGLQSSGNLGAIQVSDSRIFSSLANFEFKGANTGTFITTPSANTVNNLTISGSTVVKLTSTLKVDGVLTISNNTTFDVGQTVLSAGSTFSTAGLGILKTANTSDPALPVGRNWIFDVFYYSSSPQMVVEGNYSNLNTAGGNRTLRPSGEIGVANTFTPGVGSYSIAGSTVNFNGSINQLIPAFTFNNLTVSKGGVKSLAGNVIVDGTLSFSTADLSIGANALTLNGGIDGTNNLMGSETSVLNIGGAGNSVTLGFKAGFGRLRDYTQTRSAVVTLANSLDIDKLVSIADGARLASTSNGFLTLLATSGSYAQISKLEGVADVTGFVNVQTFFTGENKSIYRGDRMVSFPVQDDFSENIFRQLQKRIVVTGPGGPTNGFDWGGGNPNAVTLSTYEEPENALNSFRAVPNIGTLAEQGRAVFVFFRGNRDDAVGNKVNRPYAFPEDVIGNYKGTINRGDVEVKITDSNPSTDSNHGMNAVGNPYPAAINWDEVWKSNKTLLGINEIRINKAGGGFVTRKVIDNIPTAINAGETMASEFIRPGQGFYVRTLNSGKLTFSETHKAVSTPAALLLSIPSNTLLATNLNDFKVKDVVQKARFLRINIQQNDLKDETLILFKDGLSSSFDNNDAIYFAGNTVLIGSLSSNGQVTSINAMPDVRDVEQLKLYVNATAGGVAKLNFTDLSAGEGYEVFLKDALSPDKLIDLKQQSVYEFLIDRANPATYGTNRFAVIFKPELIAAPVFTAQKVKSNVELNWTSLVASKVKYFEVEASDDNVSFRNIGQVTNAGIQNDVKYSFVDKTPVSAIRYYRLKQFNINGSITFTDPQMVNLGGDVIETTMTVSVYPNPATQLIQVQLSGRPQVGVSGEIYNVQGEKLTNAVFLPGQLIQFDVSRFTKGIYLLELREKESKKVLGNSKFIVGL